MSIQTKYIIVTDSSGGVYKFNQCNTRISYSDGITRFYTEIHEGDGGQIIKSFNDLICIKIENNNG